MAETAKKWISFIVKRATVRDDFDTLCQHYSGEGNVNHCVATEDCLQKILHYKSKLQLSLNTFLDRMQKMSNIFRNEVEPMAASTQVRELFRRVKHPKLQYTVKALEVGAHLDVITY